MTLFANAVVAACDANDGVKDGIINDPRACKFDPGGAGVQGRRCRRLPDRRAGGDGEAVGLSGQNEVGEVVYPGRSPESNRVRGAHPGVGKPMNPLWGDMPQFVGHRDANWDPMSFDLDKDLALTLKNASFIEASNPDLAKFKARGGKLLLWHGWADPGPPENTINYYSHAAKARGGGARTTGCGCS